MSLISVEFMIFVLEAMKKSRIFCVHDPDWGLFTTRTDFLVHQKHTKKTTDTLSNITTLQNMTLKGGKKNW